MIGQSHSEFDGNHKASVDRDKTLGKKAYIFSTIKKQKIHYIVLI